MMKKLLFTMAIFFATISYGQTVWSYTDNAADELMISSNGYFVNKDGSGVLTAATLTVTSTTTFEVGNEPTYPTLWSPFKTSGGTKVFVKLGGYADNNYTSSTLNGEGTVRTRVWEVTTLSISDQTTADTMPEVIMSSSGFASKTIQVSSGYYVFDPGYVAISNIKTTYASIQRGTDFDVTFDYTANTDIENMQVTMYLKYATEGVYSLGTVATGVVVPTISVTGTEVEQSGTVTLNFTTDSIITGSGPSAHSFNVEPTADLGTDETYYLRFYRDYTDGDVKFSTGSQFIFADATVTALTDAPLSLGNVENKKYNVYPNPTTGLVTISDIEGMNSISVSNVLGQVVKTFAASNQIDISSLQAGVYILQADNGFQTKVVKN